jgi:hypothetical protein
MMEAVCTSETSAYFYKTYTAPYPKRLSSVNKNWDTTEINPECK